MKNYTIVAHYCYAEVEDPAKEVKRHALFLKDLDVRCRVYIAKNGINAQMSFATLDAQKYIEWIKQSTPFAKASIKCDLHHEHVFPKVTVKVREQLVALDQFPDLKKGGEHVSAQKWEEMLENRGEDTLLIDVRNDYESVIGHFEGAICPPLKTFRQFPQYAKTLAESIDPKKTKVMMYCTGGIRCETYSTLLKDLGFEKVYQLQGGVIEYGHEVGSKHWEGRLFVFDDRLSVPISDEETEVISHCIFCGEKSDFYINCANMDCNKLFIACGVCVSKEKGCCSSECQNAPRRRSCDLEEGERPKPFGKWYHYAKEKGN